jgi:hypothetical protein
MSTPNQYPDLYASIVLGTAVSPGVVTLSGHDRELAWDTESAKDQTGASSKYNGEQVGEFQASFYLASADDQIAWPAFLRVVRSTISGPVPKALPIYHPDLAENGYTEVCAKSIGGRVRDPRGGVTVLVVFIEFRPPKPKPAKAAASGGGGTGGGSGASNPSGGSEYDPNAERKAELEALLEEAKNA